ncbi:galactose mutarotase-like protein [Mollisia scopiformis]|uniref:beta-galactosidase n=1 Tax=Mollisia scopiformis TaxID=149040 RepID=A0A194WT58_MOLSC|nr:galactose mutarotase-like protein [Mollisia scopiformis]KUJ11140.1 galactose mutarotase-like protein [Mollisia scopiformis]
MADELGLYVMDEADLEGHGFYDAVARSKAIPESMPYEEQKLLTFGEAAKFTLDDPTWNAAYVERMRQLVHRDKNHPSVIIGVSEPRPSMAKTIKLYMIHKALEEGDNFKKPIVLCEYARSDFSLMNDDFVFKFDKISAQITKWSIRGNDILDETNGPQLTFWRAPTDNDVPHDAEVRSVQCSQKPSSTATIVVQSWISPPVLAWGFDTTTTYTIHGDGELRVHILANPRGESYNDKKEATKTGVWSSNVDELITKYEFPQENGNRTDTRWVQLTNNKGFGIQAVLKFEKPARQVGFDLNLQRCSAHELAKAKHPHKLRRSDRFIFRIDRAHQGLGTASCGSGTMAQHQLPFQMIDFTVDLVRIGL